MNPLLKNGLLIFLVLVGTFFLFSALPADPVRLILGVNASEDAVNSLKHELGLDKPILAQFLDYFKNLLSLDLGTSFVTRRSVAPDVFDSFVSSQVYAGFALILSICYSAATVCISYFGKPYIEKVFQAVNNFLVSIPGLLTAIAVGISFLKFDVFSFVTDLTSKQIMTASFVLAIYPSCVLSQLLISEFRVIKNKQYVLAASSFGFFRHQMFFIILRNSFLPWLAQLSNIAASLIAGAVVVEYVFSLPGLGRLIYQSILRHDYPMIQGIVLVTSVSYILFNSIVETLYKYMLIHREKV